MAAVLFAIAPFHFLRSEVHIFLAAYWAVPFGVVLATEAMQGRAGIAAPGRRPRFGWALVCAIVAMAGLYYAVFTLVLLGAASLVALARSERRAASGAVLAGALIVCLLVVSNAPTFVYEHRHGKAHGVAVRQASESETYGQKLASMVLPMQNHRITALGDVRARYDATVPIGTGMPLGSLPAAGVLTLFFVTLLTAAGGLVRLRGRHPLRDLGALQLALFLVTTIGGFSSLIAYLVSPQIRVWERSTIVFGFLGLATVVLLLDAGLYRWRSAARGFVRVGACALVVMVGALDQTSNAFIPAYSSTIPEWKDNTAFVEEIKERSLPRGSMVYQVPYVSFPEAAPVNKMNSYDPLLGYILSDSLRWSDAGYARDASRLGRVDCSEAATRAGRQGSFGRVRRRLGRPVRIHRRRQVREASIARIARARPIVAPNARYVFYSLRSLRSRLIAGTSARSVASVGDLTIKSQPRCSLENSDLRRNVPTSRTLALGEPAELHHPHRNPSGAEQVSSPGIRRRSCRLRPICRYRSAGDSHAASSCCGTGAELAIPVRVRPHRFVDLHLASDTAPRARARNSAEADTYSWDALIDPVGVQRSARAMRSGSLRRLTRARCPRRAHC